ncbi:hypothetical protein Bca4012_102574 [Brassica carinata]
MINRDSRGIRDFIVRGEILGFMKDATTAKAFAKDVFINQERKLGLKTIRYRPSLNHKRCRPGSADVAFRTRWHLMRNQSFWVPGGVWSQG